MAKKPAKPDSDSSASRSAKAPGSLPAIVILHGKENFLRQLHTQNLKAELTKAKGEIDVIHFDGSSARPADVLDECRSFGLIANYKLVVVDDADEIVKEDARPLFERYAESLAASLEAGGDVSATLLLRSDTWRAGKLDKMVEVVGRIVKCEPPTDAECVAWVMKRAKATHKSEIDKDCAALLVNRVGCDLAHLDSELGKLAAAAGPDKPITRELVVYYVGVSREEELWGIQSTLLTAGPEEGLQHLRYVLDVSREPAQRVMWAMCDLARKLHTTSRAARGSAQQQAAARRQLWGPSGDAIFNVARRVEPHKALALFRECVSADRRSKSGFSDADQIVERLVLQFSALAGR